MTFYLNELWELIPVTPLTVLGPFLPQALDALTVVVVVVMGIGVCFKHIKQVKMGGVGRRCSTLSPQDEVTGNLWKPVLTES